MISKLKSAINNPSRAFRYLSTEAYRSAVVGITSRRPLGTNVFSQDWDLLIILDTCRVDALRMVADEYSFLDSIDQIWSLGGASAEWMAATFTEEFSNEIANSAYLASNGHAKAVLEEQLNSPDRGREVKRLNRMANFDVISKEEIARLEHIWQYEPQGERGNYGHKDGHSPPRYVTDRAISVGRNFTFDRLILHYNQPHLPYVANALQEGRELYIHEQKPWKYLRETGDLGTVFSSYLDDLRWVLEDVQLVLENVDADKTVISADHGEAFGEYQIYGHHSGSLHPKIRYVPWVVTSATDKRDYQPQFDPIDMSTRSIENTLESLGYL